MHINKTQLCSEGCNEVRPRHNLVCITVQLALVSDVPSVTLLQPQATFV